MSRNYDNEAQAIRAAADILSSNISMSDIMAAVEVLEIAIDEIRGKPKPAYSTPPHGVLKEWATRLDNQPPQTWWSGQTDPWSLEPASP